MGADHVCTADDCCPSKNRMDQPTPALSLTYMCSHCLSYGDKDLPCADCGASGTNALVPLWFAKDINQDHYVTGAGQFSDAADAIEEVIKLPLTDADRYKALLDLISKYRTFAKNLQTKALDYTRNPR